MRRFWIAVVVSAALSSTAAYSQQPATNTPPAGTPKIQFDKTVYDFGTTQQVASVTGTFTFSNTGSATLQIQKPSPTCGCTVAAVKPDKLEPGEKGELVFTVNVANLRGHAEKHIIVPSNDPQSPSVNLGIKIDVMPMFDVQPQQVSLGDIRQGTITNVDVHVKRTDGQKLVINHAESSANLVRTRIEPIEGSDGKEAHVWVEIEAEGVPRHLNDMVRIFMDNAPQQPPLSVPVFGRLIGDVQLTPEQLYWGVPDPAHFKGEKTEQLTTRRVMVSATKPDQALQLSDVSSSLKDLSVQIVPVETGKTYMVVAKLDQFPQTSEQGTISFNTNIASQKQVVVPVVINVVAQPQ